MLEEIPNVITKINSVRYDKRYNTYDITAYLNIKEAYILEFEKGTNAIYYMDDMQSIPIRIVMTYTTMHMDRGYTYINFIIDKKHTSRDLKRDDEIRLFSQYSRVLIMLVYFHKYSYWGVKELLNTALEEEYTTAIQLIRYAIQYDLTFIKDKLSDDVCKLADVALNTNHRM